MESNWLTIISAAFAGGLLNQLFSTFFGDRIAFRRDFIKWRRVEKYKTYSELIDLTSSSNPKCGFDKWPGKIRSLSQKVYLLHNEGKPPQKLCDSLEEMFQLSVEFKSNDSDKENLRNNLRTIGSNLRRLLAKSLKNEN